MMSTRVQPQVPVEGFNPAINGFRGLCVLLVFLFHVANSGLAGPLAAHVGVAGLLAFFASACRYGVELFFMISGFVIVGSLQRHGAVGTFLRDRCIRIFPVWTAQCVLLFIGGVLVGWKFFAQTDALQRIGILVGNLLLLPPVVRMPMVHPISWSLTYEWMFYLLAAAAFWLHGRENFSVTLRRIAWGIWALITLSLIYFMPRGLWFVPGVLVALGYVRIKSVKALRWPFVTMLLFLCAWRLIDFDLAHPGASTLAELFNGFNLLYAVVAMFAALHFFSSIAANAPSVWLLRSRAMQALGTISYSFYLWHTVAMFMVKPFIYRLLPTLGTTLSVVLFSVVSMLIAVVLSWISWQWLEQKLGRALRRRVKRERPPATEDGAPVILRTRGM